MPSTVNDLLGAASLRPQGVCRWRDPVPSTKAGLYLVSLSDDPQSKRGVSQPPLSQSALASWVARVPAMAVDGARATVGSLRARLSAFWLPDESVLYIGKAGGGSSKRTLGKRVREYYITQLGEPRPHSGGHWIKTLSNIDSLYVHWSECAETEETEQKLIEEFARHVSTESQKKLFDCAHPYPFANLELTKGIRKFSGIQRSRAPRKARP